MCDGRVTRKVNSYSIDFLCFWKSQWLHLFDQKYSKNCNIAKYNNNLNKLFTILIYIKK